MGKLVMHCYSIDKNEPDKQVVYQAMLSIFGIYALSQLLNHYGILVPWWIESPSILTLYKVISTFFNKRAWHWSLWKYLGIPERPNLNGIWEGLLASSFDDFQTPIKVQLLIQQNFDEIQVTCKTPNSTSTSNSAVLFLSDPNGPTLCYTFRNIPNPDSVDTMAIHDGTSFLTLSENNTKLIGGYYTGRGRKNHGKIELTRA